jgi:CheY-like chemotaxis protein
LNTGKAAARVLVVDDDASMRLVVSMCLKMDGHDVREATSAEVAWELMHESRPALVISDVKMVGKSGLDLLREVRADESLEDVPFVLMTGDAEWDDRALGAGASAVLLKPFSIPVLRDTVRRFV